MMLSIGGIFFLSLLIINVNTGTGNRITELVSNKAVIEATALAEGTFEEIRSRSFDEETVSNPIDQANLLTTPFQLGKDGAENGHASYDDIDDFNNDITTYNASGMGDFEVRVNVYYVEEDDPDYDSTTQTFLKRVRIRVTNNYLPTELIFNRLISY